MTAPRAFVLLAGAAAGLSALSPAMAQVDDGIVLDILRQCARIDDATARLACYDNNIRAGGGQARASVPGQMDRPRGGGAVVAGNAANGSASGASGFGGEDVRTPGAQASSPAGQSLTARVARVDPRQPGVYLLSLADGSQWLFGESVDNSYQVPRSGDTVTIDRAALGSYLMRFNRQIGVRIQRVR